MTELRSADEEDRALRRRIARLMRGGTGAAAALFATGAILGWAGAPLVSTAMLIAGCSTLVLLPFTRLLLMLGAFARRRDALYVGITATVIVLVIASAATGLLR
ncbi:DUF1634 domain-containing protein [Microbacterium sp. MYb62]|uniref:DUF1634 domain-containing protein n=1 Tax=Microbacterium sp. MYb62 TaxID=1848690 RepID=UPI000CFA8B4E|nr:DUF1634 domain-containing protein [Microbacterium sp. MYb62]PRB14166.1 hypothetical protein CQ042_11830 [Microbacterium sp. MYb62]